MFRTFEGLGCDLRLRNSKTKVTNATRDNKDSVHTTFECLRRSRPIAHP